MDWQTISDRELCINYTKYSMIAQSEPNLGLLKRLQTVNRTLISWEMAAYNAAKKGNIEFIKAVIDNDKINWKSIASRAAEEGFIPILDVILSKHSGIDISHIVHIAAVSGHLDVLLWLQERGNIIDWSRVSQKAAQTDNLDLIKYIERTMPSFDLKSILDDVINQGSIKILEYAFEKGLTIDWESVKHWAMGRSKHDNRLFEFLNKHDKY